jgi:hypothetical protein
LFPFHLAAGDWNKIEGDGYSCFLHTEDATDDRRFRLAGSPDVDVGNPTLATVERKLGKHYSTDQPLWLLLHTRDLGAFDVREPDGYEVASRLHESSHPFEKVWFMKVVPTRAFVWPVWPVELPPKEEVGKRKSWELVFRPEDAEIK